MCGKGRDGKFYVLVDFVAGPLGCAQCSIMDLFAEDGRRLTVNGINVDRIIEKNNIIFNKMINVEEYGK